MPDTVTALKARLENTEASKPVAATKPLKTLEAKIMNVSRQELIDVCATNPDHPTAKVYAEAVKKFSVADTVAVETIDLRAIIDNKKVIVTAAEETQDVEGLPIQVLVSRKSLVEFDTKDKPTPLAAVTTRRPTNPVV